jgi:hypothetical protein
LGFGAGLTTEGFDILFHSSTLFIGILQNTANNSRNQEEAQNETYIENWTSGKKAEREAGRNVDMAADNSTSEALWDVENQAAKAKKLVVIKRRVYVGSTSYRSNTGKTRVFFQR